jgi:hypothetical protein
MANGLQIYRKLPIGMAFVLAIIFAALISLGLTASVGFILSKLLGSLNEIGPGAGVLVITAIPNIVIPAFVALLSALVNLHHSAFWRIPVSGFLVGCAATWIWIGPFELAFAPVVLGTGAIACVVACLMLQGKGESKPQHVI